MESEKCRQEKCEALADYRYTWPGRDESFLCWVCSVKLKTVAQAMGMYIQLVPLDTEKRNSEPDREVK